MQRDEEKSEDEFELDVLHESQCFEDEAVCLETLKGGKIRFYKKKRNMEVWTVLDRKELVWINRINDDMCVEKDLQWITFTPR